jgi:hypothetical protein
VPLPAELTTASPLGPSNPIPTLIRNGFRRNKRDTSARLVVSALKNGYRYLTLFSRAADPSTPEHASVLSFLRENETRVLALKAKAAAQAANRISTAPIEGRTKLLTKISAAGEPPVYAPTEPPRPLASFPSGVRKPPTLCDTTGVPFLRMKKPQPRFLERILRQKSRRRAKRILNILEMQEGGMADAEAEDEWETLMEELGVGEEEVEGAERDGVQERTYKKTLWDSVVYVSDLANNERLDMVARGETMWKMVLAEQELALQEEKERLVREGREGEEPKVREWKRPVYKRGRDEKSGKGKKAVGKSARDGASE